MTHISKRTLVKVAGAAVAAALMLSACGTNAADTPSGPVSLNFWHSASGAAAKSIDETVAKFNEANKGKIEIKALFQGKYDDAMAKLINSVQAKNTPDIMQANDVNTVFMVDSGLIVPVADINEASKDKYDFAKLSPAVAKYYTMKGKVYSMPFQVSQPALYVNPGLLEKAGLTPESLPKDLPGVLSAAQTIKEKSGKAGIVFHLTPWWYEQFVATSGEVYCTPENGVGNDRPTAVTLGSATQIGYWTTLQKMYANKSALNVGKDGDVAQTSFAAGDAAMLFGSSAALANVMKNATSFKPVLLPFPVSAAEGGAVPGGNSVWVLGKDPKGAKEQAAWKFLQYLGSDEVQQMMFKTTGYLPGTSAAITAVSKDAAGPEKVLLDQLAATKSTTASAGCHMGALQKVRGELTTGMEAIVIAGKDPAATIKGVEDASVKLIDDYNKKAKK